MTSYHEYTKILLNGLLAPIMTFLQLILYKEAW